MIKDVRFLFHHDLDHLLEYQVGELLKASLETLLKKITVKNHFQ